ncbi:MAG: Phytoene dehydrogenase and related proteins, partial [uncultured Nocardioides sp.]
DPGGCGPGRRGHRRRPQRADGRQPPGGRRLVGARPGGPGHPRRRRTQRPRAAPRLRPRHVQRLLPPGRVLPHDRPSRPGVVRPAVGARPRRARAPHARRGVGHPPPRPRHHRRRPRAPAPRRRGGVAGALRDLGPDRAGARRRPHLTVPARPGRHPAARRPAPRRGPGHRPDAGDPGGVAGPAQVRRSGAGPADLRQRGARGHASGLARVGGLRDDPVDARADGRLPGAARRSAGAHRRPGRPPRGEGRAPGHRHRRLDGGGRGRPGGRRRHRARGPVRRPARRRRGRVGPRAVRAARRPRARPAPGGRGHARVRGGPRHGQGRLGAVGPDPVGVTTGVRPRHGARRRLGGGDDRVAGAGLLGPRPGAPVPADRADDGQRPDPLAGGDRVVLGLHPRPPARVDPRRRARRDHRALGPRRLRAVRRPDAGTPGGPRPRLRLAHPRPSGPRPPRAGGPQRQPHRRGRQRRHGTGPPAAGLPAGPRHARPSGDGDPRPLPRLGRGTPGRRGARLARGERRTGRTVAGPPRPGCERGPEQGQGRGDAPGDRSTARARDCV